MLRSLLEDEKCYLDTKSTIYSVLSVIECIEKVS